VRNNVRNNERSECKPDVQADAQSGARCGARGGCGMTSGWNGAPACCTNVGQAARARPVRRPGRGVRRPFFSPGGCRYRAIVRRSRPARNCHFVMRGRLWFLC